MVPLRNAGESKMVTGGSINTETPYTGDFISMAPNFDNNIALISRGYPSDKTRKNDLFIRDFIELFEQIGVDYYLPVLHEEMIKKALSKVSIEVDTDYIIHFIINGYTQLTNHFPIRSLDIGGIDLSIPD